MSEEQKKEQETVPIEPLENMVERLSVNTVFGQPNKEGDVTIIPVARVNVGFGYGFGHGTAPSTKSEVPEAMETPPSEEKGGMAEGSGGGAGGAGSATPIGYIEITPECVSFRPIVDETRLGMAGIAMGAWSVFWTFRTLGALIRMLSKKR